MLDRLRLDPARLDGDGPPAAGAGRGAAPAVVPGRAGAARRAGRGAAQAGRRDRRELRGPAERGRRHRLAAAEVPQRRGAADRLGRDRLGGRAAGRGDRARPSASAGLDPAAIQLVRLPGRDTARALVGPARPGAAGDPARQRGQHPRADRGGGPARRAHAGARRRRRRALPRPRRRRRTRRSTLVEESLDRLGVCNRLNLLLVAPGALGRPAARRTDRAATGSASPRRCRRTTTRSGWSGRCRTAARRR